MPYSRWELVTNAPTRFKDKLREIFDTLKMEVRREEFEVKRFPANFCIVKGNIEGIKEIKNVTAYGLLAILAALTMLIDSINYFLGPELAKFQGIKLPQMPQQAVEALKTLQQLLQNVAELLYIRFMKAVYAHDMVYASLYVATFVIAAILLHSISTPPILKTLSPRYILMQASRVALALAVIYALTALAAPHTRRMSPDDIFHALEALAALALLAKYTVARINIYYLAKVSYSGEIYGLEKTVEEVASRSSGYQKREVMKRFGVITELRITLESLAGVPTKKGVFKRKKIIVTVEPRELNLPKTVKEDVRRLVESNHEILSKKISSIIPEYKIPT